MWLLCLLCYCFLGFWVCSLSILANCVMCQIVGCFVSYRSVNIWCLCLVSLLLVQWRWSSGPPTLAGSVIHQCLRVKTRNEDISCFSSADCSIVTMVTTVIHVLCCFLCIHNYIFDHSTQTERSWILLHSMRDDCGAFQWSQICVYKKKTWLIWALRAIVPQTLQLEWIQMCFVTEGLVHRVKTGNWRPQNPSGSLHMHHP